MSEAIPAGSGCRQCGHPYDDHVMVATEFATIDGVEDVPLGGSIYCPVAGCECGGTFDVPQARARVSGAGA